MMKFSFVKGLGPQSVLGFSKHEWENLHLYAGIFMLVMVIIHLISGRTWILKVGAQNRKWAVFLTIAMGIVVLLALSLSPTTLQPK